MTTPASGPTSATATTRLDSPARRGAAVPAPPHDARDAFEQALARLQRRLREAADDTPAALASPPATTLAWQAAAEPAEPATPATPDVLAAATGPALPAGSGPAPAALPPATAAALTPAEVCATLSALRVPAAEQGPQQWQFHFAPAGLPVQALTLTGQPGAALHLQLHAPAHLPLRERDFTTQRLAELRQRLAERGAELHGIDWTGGSSNDDGNSGGDVDADRR